MQLFSFLWDGVREYIQSNRGVHIKVGHDGMFLSRLKFIEGDHLCMSSTLMTSSVDTISLNYGTFFGFMYYLFILVLK
jgi:hypothetical protein